MVGTSSLVLDLDDFESVFRTYRIFADRMIKIMSSSCSSSSCPCRFASCCRGFSARETLPLYTTAQLTTTAEPPENIETIHYRGDLNTTI